MNNIEAVKEELATLLRTNMTDERIPVLQGIITDYLQESELDIDTNMNEAVSEFTAKLNRIGTSRPELYTEGYPFVGVEWVRLPGETHGFNIFLYMSVDNVISWTLWANAGKWEIELERSYISRMIDAEEAIMADKNKTFMRIVNTELEQAHITSLDASMLRRLASIEPNVTTLRAELNKCITNYAYGQERGMF